MERATERKQCLGDVRSQDTERIASSEEPDHSTVRVAKEASPVLWIRPKFLNS